MKENNVRWPISNCPIFFGLVLLIMAAIALIIGYYEADNFAVFAYFFLLVGITIRFFEFMLQNKIIYLSIRKIIVILALFSILIIIISIHDSNQFLDITVYRGTFHWDDLDNGSLKAVYYPGWKSVIRTDKEQEQDTLTCMITNLSTYDNDSLIKCPYKFSLFSPKGWSSFNSTLIYIKTDQKYYRVDNIFSNGKQLDNDIIGIWWETDWMGMETKPITLPVDIPPNQKVIIQINHDVKNIRFKIV